MIEVEKGILLGGWLDGKEVLADRDEFITLGDHIGLGFWPDGPVFLAPGGHGLEAEPKVRYAKTAIRDSEGRVVYKLTKERRI